MKRYFHLPKDKLVAELDVKKGSTAATAGIDVFKTHFKCDDLEEVTREEYNKLCKLYHC